MQLMKYADTVYFFNLFLRLVALGTVFEGQI